MTESLFWSSLVRPKLISFGKLKRIEDLIEKGTPDVVYCLSWLNEPAKMGWIELKKLRAWPGRSTTIVKLPHFTFDQVAFLESWGRKGAATFLLAQVGSDFLLFRWDVVREVQTGLCKVDLLDRACVYGINNFPTRDILRCLTK
jgi:hypothetical protein